MARSLHGVAERAGLSTWLGRAWCRAEAPGGGACRGGGHPQAELVAGRFRRWAGVLRASPDGGAGAGVGGWFPARGAPRSGGGSGWRGRGG